MKLLPLVSGTTKRVKKNAPTQQMPKIQNAVYMPTANAIALKYLVIKKESPQQKAVARGAATDLISTGISSLMTAHGRGPSPQQ